VIERRTFLATLTGSLLAAPLSAAAQQTGKVYRVGYMSPAPAHNPVDEVFERALKELGYVEGHNLLLERRYAAGRIDQFALAADELARLKVDLIVAWSPAATAAAVAATTSIPIVFLAGGAAVEHGLVAGLAHPGRNVTGITFQANKTLAPKYLELLKEMVPKLSLVAVLRVRRRIQRMKRRTMKRLPELLTYGFAKLPYADRKT
jgi:putative ABC transport system substrate-binding protein